MYHIERRQRFSADPDAVWQFISTPSNLNRITPEWLSFQVVSPVPELMYDGLLIEYRIRIPGLGRRHWLTEIKHIRPGRSFVDEQRLGPYRFWYHYHEIIPVDTGVEMLDRVTYVPPMGFIGSLVHPLYIRPMLRRIFDYRQCRFNAQFRPAIQSDAGTDGSDIRSET